MREKQIRISHNSIISIKDEPRQEESEESNFSGSSNGVREETSPQLSEIDEIIKQSHSAVFSKKPDQQKVQLSDQVPSKQKPINESHMKAVLTILANNITKDDPPMKISEKIDKILEKSRSKDRDPEEQASFKIGLVGMEPEPEERKNASRGQTI